MCFLPLHLTSNCKGEVGRGGVRTEAGGVEERMGSETGGFRHKHPRNFSQLKPKRGLELACIESLRAFCLFVCLFYLPAKPINNPSIKWQANGINSSTFVQMSAENEA